MPRIARIVALIPGAWLDGDIGSPGASPVPGSGSPDVSSVEQRREAYQAYLLRRLEPPQAFIEEAIRARASKFG